jgi:hypothetical protein
VYLLIKYFSDSVKWAIAFLNHPPPIENIHFLVPPPLEFPHKVKLIFSLPCGISADFYEILAMLMEFPHEV